MIIPLNSTNPIPLGPFTTSGTPTITIYVNGSLISPPGTAQAGVEIDSSGTYIASYTPAGTTDTGTAGNILLVGTIGSQSISVEIDTLSSSILNKINFSVAGDNNIPPGNAGGLPLLASDAIPYGTVQSDVVAALADNALAKLGSGSVGASPDPSTSSFAVTDISGEIPPFGCLVWDDGAANSGQFAFLFESGTMSFSYPLSPLSNVPVAGDTFTIPQVSYSLMIMLSMMLESITTTPLQIDLTQAVPTSNTAHTIGDALNAARAQGFGKWVFSGTTLTLYAEDGSTVVRTFTLDSATAPTRRT